jgi:hypothetical protein
MTKVLAVKFSAVKFLAPMRVPLVALVLLAGAGTEPA